MRFKIVISIATLRRRKEGKSFTYISGILYKGDRKYTYDIKLGYSDDYVLNVTQKDDEDDVIFVDNEIIIETEKEKLKQILKTNYRGYNIVSKRIYVFNEKSKLYTEYNDTILISLLTASCRDVKDKNIEKLDSNIRGIVSTKNEDNGEYTEDYIPPKHIDNISRMINNLEYSIHCLIILNRILRLKTKNKEYPISGDEKQTFGKLVYKLLDIENVKYETVVLSKEKKDGIQLLVKYEGSIEMYFVSSDNLNYDFNELLEFSDNRSLSYILNKCPTMRLPNSINKETTIPQVNIKKIFLLDP